MGKVVVGVTMSLDGFVADRHGDLNPLYPDLDALRKTEMLQEELRTTGAAIMGRHAFDLAQGDLTGYEFQVPIFVLTHHVPQQVTKGQNDKLSVHFVTEGIESAVARAKAAAGDKNVIIIGGADTNQQILRAGLFDELMIGLVPILLGEGLRLFEHLGSRPYNFEKVRVFDSRDRIDILYRRIK